MAPADLVVIDQKGNHLDVTRHRIRESRQS